jgi:hypothetical protein
MPAVRFDIVLIYFVDFFLLFVAPYRQLFLFGFLKIFDGGGTVVTDVRFCCLLLVVMIPFCLFKIYRSKSHRATIANDGIKERWV